MFEIKEEEILGSMMDKVPNDIDKRKDSSLVYNALAPAAQEIARLRSDMDRFLNYSFISENMPEEYLDARSKEHGLTRKPATYAVKLGIFKDEEGNLKDIPLNSRFSIDKITYKAIEKIETGKYKMQCGILGTIGNYPTGYILPIEYIEGLGTAELGEILDEGVEAEDNESLFNRLMVKIQTPATSGNKYNFMNWALEVTGVGDAKVFPIANGPGTVKVVIVNSNKHKADDELIKEVFDHIEDVRPIGATISVVSAVEKVINITANISLVNGLNLGTVQTEFTKLLTEYLESISFKTSYISAAKIGSVLLSTTGVLDYTDLKVNNLTSNISLADEEIAVLGTITLGVI